MIAATRDVLAAPGRWVRELDALSYPLWVVAAFGAALALAAALPMHPHMSTGAVGGALVLTALLLRPVALLGLVLAIGAVNLAFFTGGERQLLAGMGGLDMNGIRLMGFVAGFALLLVIDRRMLRQALGRHGRWYLLFLVYAGGTMVASSSPNEGLRMLFKLAFPFLVFVGVIALVRSTADLERLGHWTLVAAAVLILVVNPLLVAAGGYSVDASGHLRIQGLGMHQNPFSQYLMAMAFLALSRYILRGRLRYLLLALTAGGWIVLTMSRTTLLAAMVGLAAMAVYGAILRRNLRPVVATALLALAVAVPLTPLALDRTFGYVPGPGELMSLASDPVALVETMRWSGRDRIWPVLYAALQSSPVVGLGLGSSAPVLRSSFSSSMTDIAHNEYLRIGVDTGLLGLGLLGAGVLVWWLGAGRAGLRSRGPLTREYALAAVAIVPAAAVIAFAGNPIDYYAQFTQYVAFFCAAALAAAALEGAREPEHADQDGGEEPVGRP